jgi:transcriptional regulator with XRE-family HTH domain
MGHGNAQKSSPVRLLFAPQPMRFRERVRRARLENGWTQAELAKFLGIRRPQTVSGWERGTKPQRRHYAKIAVFLGLPDERAVEALLSGDASGVDDVPTSQPPTPAATSELQRRAVEAIVFQLEGSKWKPSDDLAQLLNGLLDWAKRPDIDIADNPDLPSGGIGVGAGPRRR